MKKMLTEVSFGNSYPWV